MDLATQLQIIFLTADGVGVLPPVSSTAMNHTVSSRFTPTGSVRRHIKSRKANPFSACMRSGVPMPDVQHTGNEVGET